MRTLLLLTLASIVVAGCGSSDPKADAKAPADAKRPGDKISDANSTRFREYVLAASTVELANAEALSDSEQTTPVDEVNEAFDLLAADADWAADVVRKSGCALIEQPGDERYVQDVAEDAAAMLDNDIAMDAAIDAGEALRSALADTKSCWQS